MSISTTVGGVTREQTTISTTVGGVVREFEKLHTVSGGVLKELFSKSNEWEWVAADGASMTVSDDGLTVSITRPTNGEGARTNVMSLPACKITASITARLYASGFSGSVTLTCFTADDKSKGNIGTVSLNSTTNKTASSSIQLDAGEYYFVFGGGGGSQTGTTGFVGTLTVTIS